MLRYPVLSRIFKILLRIDFDITARRINMNKPLALFDHVLEQQNLIRIFEIGGVTPRLAGELIA